MKQDMNDTFRIALRAMVVAAMTLLAGSTATAQVEVHGNVYGGGNLADVKENTAVNMSAGQVYGNVYGGGKGKADNFKCDKAMVGEEKQENACADPASNDNKDKGTIVTISNGTVGTLEGEEGSQTLKEGTGNVYGGGEIGRVEWNTQVRIGVGTEGGTFAPVIYGNVFGAGKGLETHGYSALVRGNSTVTIQGNAKVGYNVYGGGEMSTVGRYWVKGIPITYTCDGETVPTAPETLPDEMPYKTRRGGKITVTVQGKAQIGPDNGATETAGHVFGAGKGVTPNYVQTGDKENWSRRMVDYKSTKHTGEPGTTWDYYEAYTEDQIADTNFPKYVWEYFVDDANPSATNYKTGKDKYFEFLQTLALVTGTEVTIGGDGVVKGNVYGGSESGFVQDDTRVTIEGENCTIGTTTYGNVFGGGKGIETFAEAGKVKGTTMVAINNGTVSGNVYGGGELGDVGIIDKTEKDNEGKLTYNYHWKQSDGNTANVAENNTITVTNNNTGICKVAVSGGTIGTGGTASAEHGNVYGAGKGTGITWWCEKAISYATYVTITAGTVNGNVYGGGQVGRVEDDAKVMIGTAGATGDSKPTITGSVFGAGAGLETHGYSALVRGNAEVTVQGTAQIGGSVYGGGETASVGKFEVVGGLPTKPKTGGTCIVNIKDNAKIGSSGTGHNVYGACKGVTPAYNSSNYKSVYSMQLYENRPSGDAGDTWDYYTTYEEGYTGQKFIKRYYKTETDYLDFLKTLALTSHPHVTIGGTWTPNETTGTITASGSPTVYGSVYGGGQRGVTLGHVDVNMVGGTVEQDVYGGGALADTNLGNWDVNHYEETTAHNEGEDLYTRTGEEGNYIYTKVTDISATSGSYYRQVPTWAHDEGSAYYTTSVDLTGGTIKGDAYGGGLGQRAREAAEGVTALDDVPAYVFGDVTVKLNEGVATDAKGAIVNRVFAANNLNGSPQGNTSVYVYATQSADAGYTTIESKFAKHTGLEAEGAASTYDVQAVYGGGNEASYIPKSPYTAENTTGAKSQVIIEGCNLTSIKTVYGGGNAASVPETNVTVKSVYEIEDLFGGGNGKDDTSYGKNPGADIGAYKNASNSDVLYGTGNVNVTTQGGYIHELFGASNQKGSIKGDVALNMTQVGDCTLQIDKVYNAGRNADIEGDLISVLSCQPATKILEYYGGAENANVKGNVELTITNGWFEKVFAGNNQSGSIFGHIKLNVEETGCSPIRIDELYGCGNDAAYSVYGYYVQTEETENGTGLGNVGEHPLLNNEKLVLLPRTSADDPHKPVKTFNHETQEWTVYAGDDSDPYPRYDDPEVNIVSATYIGKVFGGGYGANGTVYGNPQVFINMIPGEYAAQIDRDGTEGADNDRDALGEIGIVYGGGNEADVVGNTFVNIGTKDKVKLHLSYDKTNSEYEMSEEKTVEGAYITGNVYGGGKGEAKMEAGTAGEAFLCAKAMVKGDDGTHVNIGNGFVRGNVYGGGEVGRVENNTVVTIGLAELPEGGKSTPVVNGNVFGAGKGVNTHGYAALVRGTSTAVVQADAKVMGSVYGGGEKASVGRYKVGNDGLPQVLDDSQNPNSGYCYVTIKDNAEIGPDNMSMTKEGGPDDSGYVFGAGKGVLPYEEYDDSAMPKHMDGIKQNDGSWEDNLKTYPAYSANTELDADYVKFIKSLALATQTEVSVEGNAFVKGGVYGGSENGFVQKNTKVTIKDQCQIGNGYVQMNDDGVYLDNPLAVNRRYTEDEWTAGRLILGDSDRDELKTLVGETYYTTSLPECASWKYGQATEDADRYAPYDKFYGTTGYADSKGGRLVGDDGHTFYGNVFGGGSGYFPYKPGRWFEPAGAVYGNTEVNITGGHILTNVYGGNEMTNVSGTCTVNFGGTATLGVPRTLKQIDAHPLTCYLFGAGKGDQRVFFNKSTNVENVVVNITGGRIYGSVFGGGEDGHVLRDVTMTIGTQTTTGEGAQATTTTSGPTIGTWGTSYVDGNVFGGGRGFGGDAYTAGNVAGSVTMNINGGTMLGSIYGGGRLGSVGYGLFDETTNGQPTPGYGEMRADEDTETGFSAEGFFTNGRGHIDITISGGTIGNDYEYIVPNSSNIPNTITQTDISKWTSENWTAWKAHNHIPKTEFDASGRLTHTKGGNVFTGGMGRQTKLDGQTLIDGIDWWKLGCVKQTKLTIRGGHIKSNVYGGGELGAVIFASGSTTEGGITEIDISGSAVIGTPVTESVTTGEGQSAQTNDVYTFGSVFGGGMGSENDTSTEEKIGGRVAGSTKITMAGGYVKASVYGGGELAVVQGSHTAKNSKNEDMSVGTEINISGGTIGYNQDGFGGATMGNVYGGGKGSLTTANAGLIKNNTLVKITGTPTIYHNIYGGGAYGSVGTFGFTTSIPDNWTNNTGKAEVIVEGGTIGINGHENGMVFGSSRGDVAAPVAPSQGATPVDPNDRLAWVYDTHVVIGNSSSSGGPSIKGTVYGSGENGHTFNNTLVDVNKGTIGIETGEDITYTENGKPFTKGGAAYPYRGNVYGGGCGTDMYDSNGDGTDDTFNPLAGIVLGNATVNINGGTVVRNVYGAGAMGSVGKTTTTEGVTTVSGGTTNINVSGGTIGVDGTNGDGNVFGAARGNENATINEFALVKKETSVSVTGGTIKGNVYGGGELGCVGTFTVSQDMRTFDWQDTDGTTNNTANSANKNTGVCNVTVDGSSAVINGHVYGAGRGKDDTFWCEKGIAYSTNVNIKNGTVGHNVYGGGEVGRVETDTQVKIGSGTGTAGDTFAPTITGSVFGGGAGVETHGYSALVRGNTTVSVEGNAKVEQSIYGGGQIASVGRYALDSQKMPSILQGGGYCYVTVQGHATIGEDVFGAGKGVTPHFNNSDEDLSKRSRRMSLKDGWEQLVGDDRFNWDYLKSESDYSTYLETLALATHPEVTIDGNATVSGSVFGGGELGLTKGSVIVNIQGGTITEDVYGGGSLANTNTTNSVDTNGDGVADQTVDPTTTVNLKGGTINRNVYGGGLGRLAKDAVEAQPAVSAVEAKVYGEVLVNLNKPTTTTTGEGEGATTTTTYGDCEVKGTIFGCNNLNGSPQKDVTVHVYKTVKKNDSGVMAKPTKDSGTYEMTAVYGGGNLAAYYPDDSSVRETAIANVIIDGCDMTSIKQVYGGGNAASVPATHVVVNGTYEIEEVFGGGNGFDKISKNGTLITNPGANVGFKDYWDYANEKDLEDYDTKEERLTNTTFLADYVYGSGKASVDIYGGLVHRVFGGSNTRGNVREAAVTMLQDMEGCDFKIDEAYGGGKSAPMDAEAKLLMACIPGLSVAYGGAQDADVQGGVTMTITNGTFDRVFGGNNISGTINGPIVVNIEETGCRPIVIGQLYGGGNQAAYTALDDGEGPTLNVHSFTSIGEIYGGGYGETAVVKGDTHVNIDVTEGKWASNETTEDQIKEISFSEFKRTSDGGFELDGDGNRIEETKTITVTIPGHKKDAIGAIGNVFGGGNAAKVDGNTNVNIGTRKGADEFMAVVDVPTNVAENDGYYTRSGDGTYTAFIGTPSAGTTYYKKYTIKGADIRGNVYGGGNNADVTGNTNVVIGKKAE